MSFKLLLTIIFVSLLLSAGLLYYRLEFQDPVLPDTAADDSSGVTSAGLLEGGGEAEADLDAPEFARLLRVIEGITIDRSIFSSAVFTSLFDFNFVIPSQTAGRRNPFAPVGTP